MSRQRDERGRFVGGGSGKAPPDFVVELTPHPSAIGDAWRDAAAILSQFLKKDVVAVLGDFGSDLVRRRTRVSRRDGEGAKGAHLAAYSPRYARRKGVSVKQVNLTRRGDLLDSIKGSASGLDAIVRPEGEHYSGLSNRALAAIHHFGIDSKGRRAPTGWLPARPFFGFTEQEQGLIAGTAFSLIEKSGLIKMGMALERGGA